MSNNHCTQQYFSNVSSRVANKPLYTSREDKPAWVNSVFSDILKESHTVLDVGCDMKQLGRLLSDRIAYKGIDICGKPDIKLDLDQTLKIPFADKEFDLVFCAEVLEHLENFHAIFDELCRVSSKYLLISLPNALAGVQLYYANKIYTRDPESRKTFGKHMKFYGLPPERPFDRHRWFFNAEEAVEFMLYRSGKNGFELKEVLHTLDCENKYINIFRLIASGFDRKRMINNYSNTIWFLLRRRS